MMKKAMSTSIAESALRDLIRESLEPVEPNTEVKDEDNLLKQSVKESVRYQIRKIVEAVVDKKDEPTEPDTEEDYEWRAEPTEKSYFKTDGASWEEIMTAMGATTPSKHRRDVLMNIDPRTVGKSDISMMQYASWLAKFEPAKFDAMHTAALEEYIEYLSSSEDLSEDDIEDLYANTDIVEDTEGFRKFWIESWLEEHYKSNPRKEKIRNFFIVDKPLYVDQYGKKTDEERKQAALKKAQKSGEEVESEDEPSEDKKEKKVKKGFWEE